MCILNVRILFLGVSFDVRNDIVVPMVKFSTDKVTVHVLSLVLIYMFVKLIKRLNTYH